MTNVFSNFKSRRSRIIVVMLFDVMMIQISTFLALWVRYDFHFSAIHERFLWNVIRYTPVNTMVTITVFMIFYMYDSIWSYIGIDEAINGMAACAVSWILQAAGMNIVYWQQERCVPNSFYILYPFMLFMTTVGGRFSYRFMRAIEKRHLVDNHVKNVMLIGAGEAGMSILREYQNSKHLTQKVACIIDDNPMKYRKILGGCQVVGNRSDIVENVRKYGIKEIVIAIPSLKNEDRRQILTICQRTDCEIKILPGIYQLVDKEARISMLRHVNIEDLLGRDTIKVDLDEIVGYVSNKVIMVTGGGGSIGSELCRQLARHQPSLLIIVEIYENNAYDIEQELKHDYPELKLVVLIASVRNTKRMQSIFEKYRPQIIYHAAAHKHVPLMEESPNEAIKNNVFGTFKTAVAAGDYGVERFVLISTDKAVNPVNIMGASKRICEMIIQTMNNRYDTEFVAVRFGNVLGSNGSVIPLFEKQIQSGGPVTVTHPDIIRYFMTIPEAVSLVLQAGAYAKGGEIFVFDMGDPVRIADLAKNMIRLSGYIPDQDIKIEFTGLRPGEKLYEEMLMQEEELQNTDNHLIHIGRPIQFDEEEFLKKLKELKEIVDEDADGVREKVKEIVTTYQPKE